MFENPVEWFQSKIADVANEGKRKTALSEMKSFILNAQKDILNDLVRNVPLNNIFESLKEPARLSEEEIEHICIIVYELLMQLPSNERLESFTGFLHDGLVHNSGEVTRIAVKLLEKSISENTAEAMLERISPMIPDIVACLGSSEDGFPEGAKSVLIKIGSNPQGVNLIFSSEIIKKLEEVMNKKDVAKIRVCEIVIDIAKLSPENLTKAIESRLLDRILLEFSSDDVIMQLCILENLSNLGRSSHGLAYLMELEFVKNLEKNLLSFKRKPMSFMLLPGIIEFFGNLCSLQPEGFVNQNPQMLELLFASMDTVDEVLLGILIKTVGQIGSTSCGRHALDQKQPQLENFFKRIGSILSTKNDLTISALNSLCELVKFIEGDESANLIAKKWYESITPNALNSLVKLAKLPFSEFRLAAFGFLSAIAAQKWGTEKLVNYPGMIEFLTNRSTEFEKACKEIKFNIVYNIVHCVNVEELVEPKVLMNLNTFVSEGPFYVPPAVEMATQEAL